MLRIELRLAAHKTTVLTIIRHELKLFLDLEGFVPSIFSLLTRYDTNFTTNPLQGATEN